MPLALALELVLNEYGIFDVDTFVAVLQSPHHVSQMANLIDNSRVLIDATAGTAHVSMQTEPATATVGTTMDSIVDVREAGSMATFSPVTGARMVTSEVQCSPSRPQMVQRAVQATTPVPPRVVTRDASVATITWQEHKSRVLSELRADAREDVLEEFEPTLERAVVAAEVQAERAAAKLREAGELKESVRAGFEKQARMAAAALADRRAAAQDREAAVRYRSHNEGVVEQLRARLKAVGDWSDA